MLKAYRIVYILLLTLSGFSLFAQLHPANLKCEYLTNPEGIDIPDPRFYWQLKSGEEGQFQSAYQILVATSKEKLDQNKGDAFDSKKVKSNQNTHVVYKI
jgi:alpha-L-rhamnosidase